jgi:hypothetical protein
MLHAKRSACYGASVEGLCSCVFVSLGLDSGVSDLVPSMVGMRRRCTVVFCFVFVSTPGVYDGNDKNCV